MHLEKLLMHTSSDTVPCLSIGPGTIFNSTLIMHLEKLLMHTSSDTVPCSLSKVARHSSIASPSFAMGCSFSVTVIAFGFSAVIAFLQPMKSLQQTPALGSSLL